MIYMGIPKIKFAKNECEKIQKYFFAEIICKYENYTGGYFAKNL